MTRTRLALVTVAVTGLLVLTGCSNKRVTADMVRADMSPELHSVAQTYDQHKNMYARSMDTTSRQIWDDLDTILLLDKPVRLSKYPIP